MIGIDILPQQGNFLIALFKEFAGFFHNGLPAAAAFLATCVGNHAIGAEILASAHNRDKGRNTVRAQPHRFYIVIGLAFGEQHIDALAAGIHLIQKRGQRAVSVGAHHQVYIQIAFQKLFLEAFGHAAHQAHLEPGALLLERGELLEPVQHPLFGMVADGTGVHQYQIGFRAVGRGIVAVFQKGNQNLRIGKIHLASVGLYKQKRLHGV